MTGYYIYRLRDGGYIVQAANPTHGMYNEPLYACTTLIEALEYIRIHIEEPKK